jgi:ABC-type sugar transport system permease subunit
LTAGAIGAAPAAAEQKVPRREPGPPWPLIAAFLLPALAFYAAFTAYPVVRTMWNSFHVILPNRPTEFIGLANYRALLADDIFRRAVGNTLLWAGIAPLVDVGLGLLLALVLYSKVRGSSFLRVLWFTPVLLSYVVVAILWRWLYNYDWGVVNSALRGLGLDSWATPWLGNPDTALWALMLAHVWKWAGFNMVVCLAALHALPSEVIEAAELDNCGWPAKTVFVIVPMLRPTLLTLLVLSLIGKMKIFDLVWIMTRGGPLWSTETVATYTYKRAFDWSSFDLGYPSTIAVVWFLVVIAVALTLSRALRQRERLEY